MGSFGLCWSILLNKSSKPVVVVFLGDKAGAIGVGVPVNKQVINE